MTTTDNPHIRPAARLYGLPWAEALYATPGMCYRHSDIEAMRPGPVVIEVWSIVDPHEHLPKPETILNDIAEWVAENGMTDEGFSEQVDHAVTTPLVTFAAEALVDAILVHVNRRMADNIVDRLTVTWTPSGMPLLDGVPLRVADLLTKGIEETTHALPVAPERPRWRTRLADTLKRHEARIPTVLVALGLAVLAVAATR